MLLVAQDLLNQWVHDTIRTDAVAAEDDDEDMFFSSSRLPQTQSEVSREWQQLVSDDVDIEIAELLKQRKKESRTG